MRWPLRRLAASYEMCWTFHVDGIFGATPELLVRRERGLVTSRVLAGTIRRTGDDERDLALAATLARSSKDLEEHEYAVRSVADSLAPYCSSMNVPEAPFVLHLPNVMHLATDVDRRRARPGHTHGGANALELAAALHPSAAVGGTPTKVAVELIAEIEGMHRGRYAGTRRLDGRRGDGEFGIALRSAESTATPSGSSPAAASSPTPTRRPSWPRRRRSSCRCGTPSASSPHTRQDADMERFDLSDPTFDVTSERVHAAREESWYVETNWGWAVLRYAEASALLKDRRFRQGNARWPAQNGIHSGLFSDWWQETLLSLEGDDHSRIRRLLMPAFRNKAIAAMQPRFQALANELIDGFAAAGPGRVRLPSSRSPTPPGSSACCSGCPRTHWPAGGALGRRPRQVVRHRRRQPGLPRDRSGARRAARLPRRASSPTARVHPQDDLVTTLVQAVDEEGGGRLSRHELGVALVFLAFAGMETTRNQLGLARADAARSTPTSGGSSASAPSSAVSAVEEVMRVNPTVTWVTREALEDVDFQGLHIPQRRHRADAVARGRHRPVGDAGPVVRHHRAPAAAPRLRRRVSTTASGHFVARTDMAVALPLLASRMPDAVADGPGRWLPVSGNTGPVAYPLRFTPGH